MHMSDYLLPSIYHIYFNKQPFSNKHPPKHFFYERGDQIAIFISVPFGHQNLLIITWILSPEHRL